MKHTLKGTAKELITGQRGGTLVFRCPVKACSARLKQSSTLRDFHTHTQHHMPMSFTKLGVIDASSGARLDSSMQSPSGITIHLSVVTRVISRCQKVNMEGARPTHAVETCLGTLQQPIYLFQVPSVWSWLHHRSQVAPRMTNPLSVQGSSASPKFAGYGQSQCAIGRGDLQLGYKGRDQSILSGMPSTRDCRAICQRLRRGMHA
jgi:hypothetical protein